MPAPEFLDTSVLVAYDPGDSRKQRIAQDLVRSRNGELSEGTVRNYPSEAIGKPGVSNRTQAARIARQRGWL